MSDLFGNPNCWFSHAQAHINSSQKHVVKTRLYSLARNAAVPRSKLLSVLGIIVFTACFRYVYFQFRERVKDIIKPDTEDYHLRKWLKGICCVKYVYVISSRSTLAELQQD